MSLYMNCQVKTFAGTEGNKKGEPYGPLLQEGLSARTKIKWHGGEHSSGTLYTCLLTLEFTCKKYTQQKLTRLMLGMGIVV